MLKCCIYFYWHHKKHCFESASAFFYIQPQVHISISALQRNKNRLLLICSLYWKKVIHVPNSTPFLVNPVKMDLYYRNLFQQINPMAELILSRETRAKQASFNSKKKPLNAVVEKVWKLFFSVLIFSVALETLLTFFSFHSIPMTLNIEGWRNYQNECHNWVTTVALSFHSLNNLDPQAMAHIFFTCCPC